MLVWRQRTSYVRRLRGNLSIRICQKKLNVPNDPGHAAIKAAMIEACGNVLEATDRE